MPVDGKDLAFKCVLSSATFNNVRITRLSGEGEDSNTGLVEDEMSLMDAWKLGWAGVRMGTPIIVAAAGGGEEEEQVSGADLFVNTGKDRDNIIATWSTKSWMVY